MRGLVDMEVQADEDVEFTCKVSQAGATDVQWHLQGLPLQSNEVTEVAVLGDGCTHVLQLKGVTLEDAGTVSFHVGGHSSSAQLTVRGIWLWWIVAPGRRMFRLRQIWGTQIDRHSWEAKVLVVRTCVVFSHMDLAGRQVQWAPQKLIWCWC